MHRHSVCTTVSTSCVCLSSLSGSSELFATSSVNDVRVWHASTGKELLRLSVPKLTCNAVVIRPDGKAIITGGSGTGQGRPGAQLGHLVCCCGCAGWNDGKIRAFHPQSGKAMYTIHDAHSKVGRHLGSAVGPVSEVVLVRSIRE